MMKLVIAIVSNDDAMNVLSELTREGFYVTRLSTTGGFLRAGNATLLVGTEEENVQRVIDLIGQESSRRKEIVPSTANCDLDRFSNPPIEVTVGGATIFVVDVDQFVKL